MNAEETPLFAPQDLPLSMQRRVLFKIQVLFTIRLDAGVRFQVQSEAEGILRFLGCTFRVRWIPLLLQPHMRVFEQEGIWDIMFCHGILSPSKWVKKLFVMFIAATVGATVV